MSKVFLKLLDPNRALLVRWASDRQVTDFKPKLTKVVFDGVELQVPEVPTLTLARMPAGEHGADVHKVIIAGYFDIDDEVATRLRGRIDVPTDYVVEFVEKATGNRPLSAGLDYEEVDRPTLTAGLLS